MLESYYSFGLIACLLALYLFSWISQKSKIITLAAHKKIWNWLLLIFFSISAILGVILAIMIDYQASLSWYSEMLFWHVEFGIAMTIIAIFHFAWHLPYYFYKFKKK